MRNSGLKAERESERGASLVEFCLAFPIVALLVFGIVDFARYFAVTGVLRAGAEAGINRARKIPNFDADLVGKTTADKDYVRYVAARDVILNETEYTPLASLVTAEATPSTAVLRNATVTDNGLIIAPPGTPPTLTRSAAVLRPGECTDIAGHGKICNGPVGSNLSTEQLLQQYPIRIVMVAEVQPFLPFLRPMVARGEAYGQRENVPRGPPAGMVAPEESGTSNHGSPLPPILPADGPKEPAESFPSCTPNVKECLNKSLTFYNSPVKPFDAGPGQCPCVYVDSNKTL